MWKANIERHFAFVSNKVFFFPIQSSYFANQQFVLLTHLELICGIVHYTYWISTSNILRESLINIYSKCFLHLNSFINYYYYFSLEFCRSIWHMVTALHINRMKYVCLRIWCILWHVLCLNVQCSNVSMFLYMFRLFLLFVRCDEEIWVSHPYHFNSKACEYWNPNRQTFFVCIYWLESD